MKKVLVTGSSGYIGSHLVKVLQSDYVVHGLDVVAPSQGVDVFHQVDITTPFEIKHEYDAVVHLAALVSVGESQKQPKKYYETNVKGTENVLRAVKTSNFVFASTGAVVGGDSHYAKSKAAAERVIQDFFKKRFTIFRFYNIIGSSFGIKPTNPDGLMHNLMQARHTGKFKIYGNDYDTPDGTCIRDYVHVLEICSAIQRAIEEPADSVENLGHGVGMSVKQMVELFSAVNNCDISVTYEPRRPGDSAISVLSSPSEYMVKQFDFEDFLKCSHD